MTTDNDGIDEQVLNFQRDFAYRIYLQRMKECRPAMLRSISTLLCYIHYPRALRCSIRSNFRACTFRTVLSIKIQLLSMTLK
jgi:hypothetical protein